MKKIVMWSSASSCVSWLQVWNRCICGHRCLFRLADGEKKPSARSRKRRYWRSSCYSEGKKVQGCVSQNSDPMNSILREAGELWLNASAEHTMKFSEARGTKLKFGKEKGNLEALSKRVKLMSEILARPVLRNEHLRKPHDKQIVPAKQRGIWREKCTSSKPLLWKEKTPGTEKIVCLLWIREL